MRTKTGSIPAQGLKVRATTGSIPTLKVRSPVPSARLSDPSLYRFIVENVGDLLAVIDTKGNRIWNNPAYATTLGYEPAELTGSYSLQEIHPEDVDMVRTVFEESVSTGIGRKIRYRMRHKEGHWIHLESRAVVSQKDHHTSCLVIVARDISEQIQMQEEIEKARQITSLAKFSEKIGGDFDRLLTNLLGKLSMARTQAPQGTPLAKHLAEASQSAEQCHALIEDVLSLSTHNIKKSSTFVLQDVVKKCVERSIPPGSNARPTLRMAFDPIQVEGSADLLAKALDQILLNAVESMKTRGIIQIDLTLEQIEKGNPLTSGTLKPGNYAVLRVRDQGTGIRSEDMSRVFQPYFTTKAGHQGLGLSSAMATVTEHKGTIRITSQPGISTRAAVYLPATIELPPDADHEDAPALPRILFMDDEKFVRDFMAAMLRQLGYEAVCVDDGQAMIDTYEKEVREGRPFDLVICDLLVPGGIGGDTAIEVLQASYPKVKVVVTSGFHNHPALQRYAEYGYHGALTKPFTIDQLKDVVSNILPKYA